MLKVSIITPSYNQGIYLEDNITSIYNQDYPEVEHIIIDGGSKDDSVSVLEKHHDKLKYWISEPDKGQTDAINKGLKIATGDIITWINSDDQLTPGALTKVMEHFSKNHNVDLIHGKTILFTSKGKETISQGNYLQGLPQAYLSGMTFPQPSSFFTKKALDAVGLPDEKLSFGMDYDLFLRMALEFEFLMVEDIYSKYLLHDASKTMSAPVKFADEWASIFSKLLRSWNSSAPQISVMKELGLYNDGRDLYPIKKSFSAEYIQVAFLYHLAFQLTFRYEALDIVGCKPICQYLSTHHPSFVDQNGLRGICKRIKLGKGIIGTLRKFK